MSKVAFQEADSHEKNPCFSTRLEKTFKRVNEVLVCHWMKRFYVAISLTFALICVIGDPERKDLFEPLVTALGSASIGYIGLIITVYWSIDGVYGRKWTLIFEKFYQINTISDDNDKNFHFCNMWIDAITMGVWADDALNGPLFDHLKKALEFTGQYKESLTIKLYANTLSKESAKWLLSNYAGEIEKLKQAKGKVDQNSSRPTVDQVLQEDEKGNVSTLPPPPSPSQGETA